MAYSGNSFMTPLQRRIRAEDGARMGDWAAANARGLSRWPGIAYDYASTHTPMDLANSVGGILSDTVQSAWENPAGFAADMTPGLGEARTAAQADDLYAKIKEARAAGDEETARRFENLLPLMSMSAVPFVGGLLSPGKKLATEAVEGAVAKTAAKGAVKNTQLAPRAVVNDLTGGLKPANAPVRGNTRAEIQAMQQAQLSPEDFDKLQTLRAQNPDIATATRYMLPGELSPLLTNPDAIDATKRLIDTLPSAAHFSALAKAGAPKQGWYRASTQALVDVFGNQDAPRFAALLAATSPQTSVEMNLQNALNIWKNWTAAGRPTDARQIKAIMGSSVSGTKGEDSVLDAWVNNSVRALSHENPLGIVLSGPKVDSFYRNLADDVYRVTNDAWIANATGISQDILRVSPTDLQLARGNPGYSPAYSTISALQRQGGERIGMLPHEAQETTWSVAMPLMESQTRLNMPARDILQRGLLTPDLIAGTPDFATLLKNDQRYAPILEQAGYGDQLSRLQSHRVPPQLPELSSADQRYLERTAATLENLRSTRDREKRAMVQGYVPDTPRVINFSQAEAVPGANTRHLTNVIGETPGKRAAYSGSALSPFRDIQGHDIINRSLGFNTIETRAGTGAYQPGPNMPMEYNPLNAMGVEVPVRNTRQGPRMRPYDEQKLRFGNTFRGAVLAQHAVPNNAQILDETGSNLVIRRDKKVSPENMGGLLGAYPDVAAADTGAGVNVLRFDGKQFTDEQAAQIQGLLGGSNVSRTREVTNPDMNYPDLTEDWMAPDGSRKLTDRILDEANKIRPADLRKFDNPQLRNAVGDVLDLYQGRANKGQQVRPDLMNMLRIFRDGGLEGLRKARLDPNQLLPALAGVGLLPLALQGQNSSPQEAN